MNRNRKIVKSKNEIDFEKILDKISEDGWEEVPIPKQVRAFSKDKNAVRKDFRLVMRRTAHEAQNRLPESGRTSCKTGLEDQNSAVRDEYTAEGETKKPLVYGQNMTGSFPVQGMQEIKMTPDKFPSESPGRYFPVANSGDLPEPSNFTDYKSLMICRPDDPCLEIGFDSEWENLPDGSRLMLSWQFFCIWNYIDYEFVFFNTGGDRLSIELALGCILDVLRDDERSSDIQTIERVYTEKFTVYEYSDCLDPETGDPIVSVTNNLHEARARCVYIYRDRKFQPVKIADIPDDEKKPNGKKRDWSYFHRCLDLKTVKKLPITILCHAGTVDLSSLAHEEKKDSFLSNLTEVQGGLVSIDTPYRMDVYSPCDRYHHHIYPCSITVRDTMCHAPSGKKSLATLGDVVEQPKVELPDGTKEHMMTLLKEDPALFIRYAENDSVVTLYYAAAMYGWNNCPPVTLMSAAAKYAKEIISAVYGAKNEAEFLFSFRLLHKVKKGKHPMKNRPGYLESTCLEPVSADAAIVLNFAANAYSGGYNICSEVGFFPFMTHDFDLKGAYPTAMCLIPAVDVDNLIAIDIRNEHWTKDNLHMYWDTALGPFRLFFGYIRFRFPDDCPYCCFLVNVDGVPCFPRSSDGLDGVYVTGTEIYLALQLGAEIDVNRGFFLTPAYDSEDKMLFPLSYVQKNLVQDRNLAKENDGSHSLTELTLKTMSNSIYGKIAQDVIQKNTWSGRTDDMVDIGPSCITQSIFAAQCTAIVRCLLIAAQNEVESKGYSSYSVTTDGMISNAPVDVMQSLDLYGLAEYVRGARSFLTDGEDSRIWEEKHCQEDLINLMTRANVSLNDKGVLAHGGIKSPYEKDSYDDRIWFIIEALSREGKIYFDCDQWTNLKDIIHGADFRIDKKGKRVGLDFDLKRKPVKESLTIDHPCINGETYELAHIKTEPFDSVDEFREYRKTKESCTCLRTEDDWDQFFDKIAIRSSGSTAHMGRDRDFTILRSCIIGYRADMWEIPALDECTTVQEKLDFINAHNTGRRQFTVSDWKNARRPERISTMLPREMLEDKLEELRSASAKDDTDDDS